MATKEQIFERLLHETSFRKDWIIGGLISYVPILNFLLIGWISLVVENVLRGSSKPLPSWMQWRIIFQETLRTFPLFLLYVLAPVLLAGVLTWVLYGVFILIHLDLLAWTVAWLPLAIAAFFTPALFLRSLIRFHVTEDMSYTLRWSEIVRKLTKAPQQWIPTTLMGWGVVAIGLPLAGFAAFFALTGFAMQYASECGKQENSDS